MECLKLEIHTNHNGAEPERLFVQLISAGRLLQDLAVQHVNILKRFQKTSPVQLPALYKELFTVDNWLATLSPIDQSINKSPKPKTIRIFSLSIRHFRSHTTLQYSCEDRNHQKCFITFGISSQVVFANQHSTTDKKWSDNKYAAGRITDKSINLPLIPLLGIYLSSLQHWSYQFERRNKSEEKIMSVAKSVLIRLWWLQMCNIYSLKCWLMVFP